MAQYWGDFPLSATEDEIPDVLPAGRYVSVISNGHGALTAWTAAVDAVSAQNIREGPFDG